MNLRLLCLLPLVYGLLLGCAMIGDLRPRAKPPVPISVEFRMVDDDSDGPEMSIKGSDERVRLAQGVIISRADIVSAQAQESQFGGSYDVVITVTPEAAERLRAATADNIGGRMAIVVDGVVLTAPTIQAAIGGGVAVISGNFGSDEAYDIADRLNSVAP